VRRKIKHNKIKSISEEKEASKFQCLRE